MRELLEPFCELLEGELTRQARALELCAAQREALGSGDLARLETITAELARVVRDCAAVEERRQALLREIVAQLALPEERQTLSCLIEAVPEPWRGRMARFQEAIRRIVGESRSTVRENQSAIRMSLSRIGRTLDCVAGPIQADADYDASGRDKRAGQRDRGPAVLDRRG